jgi:hypothetical protein
MENKKIKNDIVLKKIWIIFFAANLNQNIDNQLIKVQSKKYVKTNCCIIQNNDVHLWYNSLNVTVFGDFRMRNKT